MFTVHYTFHFSCVIAGEKVVGGGGGQIRVADGGDRRGLRDQRLQR